MSKLETYRGVVQRICMEGRHGPYAVARIDDLGDVTFSLVKPVWKGKTLPQEGTLVVLSDLMKKRAGWRAMRGRLVRPSDELPQCLEPST